MKEFIQIHPSLLWMSSILESHSVKSHQQEAMPRTFYDNKYLKLRCCTCLNGSEMRQNVKDSVILLSWRSRGDRRRTSRRLKAYTHTLLTHTQVRGLAVKLNWGWLYSRRRLVFVPKLCLNIEADRGEKSQLSWGFNPICIFITIN